MVYLKALFQIGAPICSRINERVEWNVGDRKQIVNGILPSDK